MKYFSAQRRRQVAERSLAVPARARALAIAAGLASLPRISIGARSNQPASVSSIASVSGSSPVAHGTLQIRSGRPPSAAASSRHDVVDDRAELIDLPPEVGLLDRQRVHDLAATRPASSEYLSR